MQSPQAHSFGHLGPQNTMTKGMVMAKTGTSFNDASAATNITQNPSNKNRAQTGISIVQKNQIMGNNRRQLLMRMQTVKHMSDYEA
jgi:hypothetical protein